MGWPQITYLLLFGAALGIHLAQHGQPKTGKHTAGPSFFMGAIVLWLLWSGGFFSGGQC